VVEHPAAVADADRRALEHDRHGLLVGLGEVHLLEVHVQDVAADRVDLPLLEDHAARRSAGDPQVDDRGAAAVAQQRAPQLAVRQREGQRRVARLVDHAGHAPLAAQSTGRTVAGGGAFVGGELQVGHRFEILPAEVDGGL
jgi:hypothetical protein